MKTFSDYVRVGAYKATADALSKAVTLVITVACARTLTPEAFGVFALAMTTGWLLGVASDAGLPMYLARTAARDGDSSGSAFRVVLRMRVLFAIGAAAVGVAAALALVPPALAAGFVLLVLAQLLGAVFETIGHLFRGIGRADVEASLTVSQRLAAGVLAVGVLLARPDLTLLAAALIAPPLAAIAAAVVVGGRLTAHATKANAPVAFRADVAPIGLGVLLSAIYFRCDVYFLEYWRGLEEVGAYNAVFRLVEALRVVPAAALAVAFPHLVRARSASALRRVGGGLAVGGAIAAVAVLASAGVVVDLLYGDAYAAAVPVLRLLALALPLFFLNYALTHQVIAWDGQRAYLAIAAAALIANLLLNVTLIPDQGMTGAAIATILTELVVTAGCLLALRGADTVAPLAVSEPAALREDTP